MAVIDRRDGLPLSKWRGHGVDFFSGLMGVLVFQVNVWFGEHIASRPWGRRERGKMTALCQSKTSSQVKKSPKKNNVEFGRGRVGQDARREKALSELGLRIVRFRNDEVMREFVRGGGESP